VRGRDWRVAPLWTTIALLAGVVTTGVEVKSGAGGLNVAFAFALVAALAMAFVRHRPGLVLGIQAFAAAFDAFLHRLSPVTVLLALITLGVLAYHAPWPDVLLGWGTVFGLVLLSVWEIAPLGPGSVVLSAGAAGLTAAPVASGRYVHGVRRAAQVAEERAAEAEVWREVEMRAARQGERSRLARDLHDIVAHHVGAMTLRASSAKLALGTSGDTAVAAAALADVATTGRQVLDELRGLLAVLRDPDAIDDDPLLTEPKAAVADAVDRVRRAGVPVSVDVDPRLGDQSLLVRATVARIAQEALINVLKHAGTGTPTRLAVSVHPPDLLHLRVDNDAPAGAAPVPSVLPASGHGLAGMRDRVALLGGQLVAGPTGAGGWVVTATVPTSPRVADVPGTPAVPAEEARA
jgi:signal transduction histidine kinase